VLWRELSSATLLLHPPESLPHGAARLPRSHYFAPPGPQAPRPLRLRRSTLVQAPAWGLKSSLPLACRVGLATASASNTVVSDTSSYGYSLLGACLVGENRQHSASPDSIGSMESALRLPDSISSSRRGGPQRPGLPWARPVRAERPRCTLDWAQLPLRPVRALPATRRGQPAQSSLLCAARPADSVLPSPAPLYNLKGPGPPAWGSSLRVLRPTRSDSPLPQRSATVVSDARSSRHPLLLARRPWGWACWLKAHYFMS
jgi:hypothetical protein